MRDKGVDQSRGHSFAHPDRLMKSYSLLVW